MRISSTVPAARASAHRASSASGRTRAAPSAARRRAAGRAAGSAACASAARRPPGRRPRWRRGPVSSPALAGLECASGPRRISDHEGAQSRLRLTRAVNILFVGDVVGGLGKRTLLGLLPALRERYAPDFVVVNGENAAGGLGITPKIADQLFAAGRRRDHARQPHLPPPRDLPYLDEDEQILRPANFLRSQPGHGWCVVERDGVRARRWCRCRATCS